MTQPPDVELARLLRRLFATDELQRFLRTHYRDLADELPTNVGLIPLASAAAEALSRHNLIDNAFFSHLRASRTRCTPQIDHVARVCRETASTSGPRPLWRLSWVALFLGVVGTAGAAAFSLQSAPARPDDSSCGEQRCAEDIQEPAPPLGEDAPGGNAAPPLSCPDGTLSILLGGATSPLCIDRNEVNRGAFCASLTARRALTTSQDGERCTRDTRVARWSDHPITHVRPDEAAAFCAERGLRLPQRREFAQLLVDERMDRPFALISSAMNLCDADCYPTLSLSFTHHDGYKTTAPTGAYRGQFASPNGLDDVFGNVREIVLDGTQAYACGSSFRTYQLEDLAPEACLERENPPLAAGSAKPTLGFRCAGEPRAAKPLGVTLQAAN